MVYKKWFTITIIVIVIIILIIIIIITSLSTCATKFKFSQEKTLNACREIPIDSGSVFLNQKP